MRDIIRYCHEKNLDLKLHIRAYIKLFPKVEETGIYKGN